MNNDISHIFLSGVYLVFNHCTFGNANCSTSFYLRSMFVKLKLWAS